MTETINLEELSDILGGVLTHNLDKGSGDFVAIRLKMGELAYLKELLRREMRKGR